MKKFYMLILIVLAFTGFSMAQTIEDFESLTMNTFDVGANGSVSVVANPDTTGINKSLHVGKMVRGMDGQPWAGWYAVLPDSVDVSANKYVHVKVWKPRISPVVFKYEKGAVNSGDVFSMQPQTLSNEWEELVFDMSVVSGKYLQIVLIPDFESPLTLTEDITLYFDDIYANNDPAVGSEPVVTFEDFEFITLNPLLSAENDSSKFTLVENPDKSPLNPSNYVIEFLRDKDAPIWAGFWSPLKDTIDVTTNKYVHVKVWKPRVTVLKFKIEGGAAGTVEIPSISPQTKTNEWEDIVFDFSEKTGTYPIIAFLPDFEDPLTLTEDITIYFDDIILSNVATPFEPVEQVISVDMNNSAITAGSKVWISGTLGGDRGTWAEPGTVAANEMTDPDGDGIYSITLNLPNGSYAYKFFWGTGWTNGDPAPGGDRTYTVTGSANLKYVWGTDGVTGVKELAGTAFKVFPNPVKDLINLQLPDIKGVAIYDIVGRSVKNVNLEGINSKNVEVNDLKAGLYFISVKTAKGNYSSKFIKE